MKLKKDYVNGLGDSLDLIPIGAWYGNGRKAQWWSPVLLGVWDAKKGCVVGVCKCMSGEGAVLRGEDDSLTFATGFSDNFYKVFLFMDQSFDKLLTRHCIQGSY
jgi:ATP-dependent DNA ligase